MRLGGPLNGPRTDPDAWIAALRAAGYRAAYAPVDADADPHLIAAFRQAARDNDIIIAETGAWSNPLSSDSAIREAAVENCKKNLLLAERLGARCCVNISGSRGDQWDGPHPDNLTEETLAMIVVAVREIIDAIEPRTTFYTLETMPCMYPDSIESYQRLLRAVDRRQFAVHFDPVNLISSPQRYFGNRRYIEEFVAALGHRIKSCHAKDIILRSQLTVHLDETRPGTGGLDYRALLTSLNGLDADLPLMLEHLPFDQYAQAAEFIRAAARETRVVL